MIEQKVKCKICGKIALARDVKGLRRHLRLSHNEIVSRGFLIESYYEITDEDAVVNIHSGTRKSYRNKKNKKWKGWKGVNNDSKNFNNPFARIIYTPMVNG